MKTYNNHDTIGNNHARNSSNSEANVSELLKNLDEMSRRYHIDSDVTQRVTVM